MTVEQIPIVTELLPCPGCGGNDTRVIGGPGTAGGPKHWAGCDHCNWRTWGDTQAEAISAWNARAMHSVSPEMGWRPLADGYWIGEPHADQRGAEALLFKGGQIYAAKWVNSEAWGPVWATADGHVVFGATHWMPLPFPPSTPGGR